MKISFFYLFTPPIFLNMEPHNHPIEKEHHLNQSTSIFFGLMSIFQGVTDVFMYKMLKDNNNFSVQIDFVVLEVHWAGRKIRPLMLACIEGCSETVQLLIDSKADIKIA